QVPLFSPVLASTFSSEHYHMSFNIGKKFSKKFLKNIEKSYRSVTNEEDIYFTYSSPNTVKNMSNSKPNNNTVTNIDKVSTNCPMEEVIATSSIHDLSHNEIELTSHDSLKNDTHTQTPINENLTNVEEDPSKPNPDKGKSSESQTATQTNLPNAIPMTVLTDIFTQTSQASNKAHKGFIPRDSFKPALSNNEIINLLKTAFIRDSNAFKFESNTTSTYKYFTIYFRTRDSLNHYIEKSPDDLKQARRHNSKTTPSISSQGTYQPKHATLVDHHYTFLKTVTIRTSKQQETTVKSITKDSLIEKKKKSQFTKTTEIDTTTQPYNKTHNINDINNWDEPSMSTPQNLHQNTSNDGIDKRITELEKQVQSLLKNIKTLQESKITTDKSIADIHHNTNLMNTSLTNVNTRLDKYDTIIGHLTTNINLLSKKEISSAQERPRKISKKATPYDQTSYKSTKSKYNLRNNKEYNNSAEDSEFVPATEDDTDIPDDAAMSDGAIFKGIIDNTLDEPVKNDTFTVKSYNPLNLLPSFNATR
ncbi:3500_t:CDS:2, partial [Rhizophagus irregularis]